MFLKTASGSSASKASTSETSSAKSASTSTVATKKSSSHSAYERPSSSGAFVIFISRPFFPSEDMSAISAFIYYFFSLCSVMSNHIVISVTLFLARMNCLFARMKSAGFKEAIICSSVLEYGYIFPSFRYTHVCLSAV